MLRCLPFGLAAGPSGAGDVGPGGSFLAGCLDQQGLGGFQQPFGVSERLEVAQRVLASSWVRAVALISSCISGRGPHEGPVTTEKKWPRATAIAGAVDGSGGV